MKKRNFIQLLSASPLVTMFKKKKSLPDLLRQQAERGDIYQNEVIRFKSDSLSVGEVEKLCFNSNEVRKP